MIDAIILLLDKSISKGVHHKNYVARQKSRLAAHLNNLKNIILQNEGIEFVWNFVEGRIAQVSSAPVLAKVIFAEELFAGEKEVEEMLFSMMHKHRDLLFKHLIIAQNNGDICQNIPVDALFRIIIGPVRLLVKQWGMSNYAFDIKVKGRELLDSLQTMLKK